MKADLKQTAFSDIDVNIQLNNLRTYDCIRIYDCKIYLFYPKRSRLTSFGASFYARVASHMHVIDEIPAMHK